MSTFLQLYGDQLDRELGTLDRSQRFTTVFRKASVNEGQAKFNDQTGCYVKRHAIALVDDTQEYDLESTSIITAGDYLRPSKTSASIKRVGATSTDYLEGSALPFRSEEELNQTKPNWRAESAGTPECWYVREDGGSVYVGLHPSPDIPAAETWTLLWPYVALPADMTDDTHEPYGLASPRTTLRSYHDGILYYAAAQCEKLRKNYEGVERQMRLFSAMVAKFAADQAPPRGSSIRARVDYRRRLRGSRPADPLRWP